MNKDCFYQDGLRFECTQCSACCRFDPGFVYLSGKEIDAMANHLAIERNEFIQKFCRRVYAFGQLKFSLIEKSNYDCIFWEKEVGGCTVYPVRPAQCSTYPFWPSVLISREAWDHCGQGCPGINRGKKHSFEHIEKEKKRYEREVYGTETE